ncbi:MAG: sigma 54-interacting transcriptional regulator, partial [Halanaerobiales bacterium]
MNKKITVLAIDEQVSLFFRRELKGIFGSLFSIEYRNMEMKPIPPVYNTDLVLYTDPEILNLLIDRIHCDAPKLMMKRTISREAMKKIGQIPAGEKVLVANINQYMANETMALIYQLGITDIQLYPFYEGITDYPDDISYIIVPENRPYDFLPDIDAKIILTGNRVFDISNVVDILSILGIDNKKAEDIIRRYLVRVPTFWYGFDYSWQNRRVLLQQWKLLLNELSEGVIISDASDQIELINEKACQLLKFADRELTGEHLPDIVQQREEFGLFLSTEDKKNELIKFKDRDLVLTIKIVEHEGNYYGKIIFIKPYREMVKVQQKLHRKIVGKGYYSSYEFSDIIGQNSEFVKTKELARKIARSSSTVLLLGESGTGKELFAGAIHNYSPRREKPFVALNCSTLPENLLESELFGYEEGAFTGAKKGGKIGHFERARQGTLFLDEIADLPLN